MTREHDGACARRKRHAGTSGLVATIAAVVALGTSAAEAAAAPPHVGWGRLVATTAAPGPIWLAKYLTPDGAIDALPRLGNLCLRDESGNDVVVMGRMTDSTIYTRLFVTFADDAPITVRYGVSRDGTEYRTVLDRDYRDQASRTDDYVISLAVDAMKVYPDVCSG